MRRMHTIWALGVAGAGLLAVPLLGQSAASGGPERYDMRAGTTSGMGAMGAGGRGGMGAMGAMFGEGGNAVQHELYLRIGSGQAAQPGAPRAEHFMPPNARLGKSVLLVSPREERGSVDELPQRPKGRMLIYWGCGERAPKGQPVVIDFAKLAAGQVPPGLWTSTIIRDWWPTAANSRSFARWPAEDGKFVSANSSLPGPHRVASNFGPEMSFTLVNDFMQPLRSRTAKLPSGASTVSWAAIPQATGYLATMFGGKMNDRGEMGDMVMWSSSSTRQFGGGLADWLSPGQVAGLVRDGTVLAPSATSCVIPAETMRDAGEFRMGTLTAFGPEENFAYPPRPANAKSVWKPDWTARIRHRSTTSWMDMAGMEAMMGQGRDFAADEADEDDAQPPPRNCRPRRGGLGGLGGVLGGLGGLGGNQPGC
jgi:hypothetical protein